jgi:hypothetical protein
VFGSWPFSSEGLGANMSWLKRWRTGVNIESGGIVLHRPSWCWGLMFYFLHKLSSHFDASDIETASYLIGESFHSCSSSRDLF